MKLKIFRISLLSTLICLSFYSSADDYFDPAMLDSQLGIDPSQIALSLFSTDNSIPEGEFIIDISVNQHHFGDSTVNFIRNENGDVVPEITPAMLENWGVNVKSIAKLNELAPDSKITNLSQYIENSTIKTDISNLKMQVNIPQIAMIVKADGYIDPALLDNGITAVFFNYFISGNRQWIEQKNNDEKNDNMFVSVQSGTNLGAWRARSNITYNRTNSESGSTSNTHFSNTYIMRAIHNIRSVLTIGETSSSNDVLDSFPFKGLKLASDEQMLPSSMRGFAPEINGIAQSNARVTVRQNGYVVYQTYVAPGAFSLKDISPAGNTGNLDVTVTEEDGTEKTFTVAYSSLPVMLRPGGFRYEVNAGRFDGGITENNKQSDFVSATAIYGLPANTTLYGGLLVSQKYLSAVGGLGVSLGNLGAFSADITHSSADFDNGKKDGQSYRLRYSKSMTTTGTSVDLTALRYSTRNYFSFSEFNTQGYKLRDGVAPWLNQRQRSSFTTSLTQSLGNYGSVYLSGSIYDYWGTDREVSQLSMGYTGSYQSVSYSVNYSIDRVKSDDKWPENRQLTVNVSVPFSIFSSDETLRNISSTYSYSRDNNGKVMQQAGLSGTTLDNRLNYGVSQGFANQGQGNSGNIYGNYNGSGGTATLSYHYNSDSKSVNGSLNGGVVLHSGGVLSGPGFGSSMGIAEIPGGEGTQINNDKSVVNSSGYALIPYMSPYNANNVGADVNTLPDNVMMTETMKTVYPTAGAVVKVKFDTRIGYQTIINLKRNDDSLIPFGAVASLNGTDDKENNTGIVGDNNILFMSGMPESGKLNIGWGNSDKQRCTVNFSHIGQLPVSREQPIRSFSAVCQ